jgi:hypothetical protein
MHEKVLLEREIARLTENHKAELLEDVAMMN